MAADGGGKLVQRPADRAGHYEPDGLNVARQADQAERQCVQGAAVPHGGHRFSQHWRWMRQLPLTSSSVLGGMEFSTYDN